MSRWEGVTRAPKYNEAGFQRKPASSESVKRCLYR